MNDRPSHARVEGGAHMSELTFDELPALTQDTLAEVSAAVAGVLPAEVRSWPIDATDLPDEAAVLRLLKEVSEWVGASKACLYYFDCRSADVDLATVERAFVKAKARKAHKRAYPHLNAPGTCLYVGSSRSLATRFRDHLGFGPKGTYALQLVHWAPPLSLQLEFVCARYAEEHSHRGDRGARGRALGHETADVRSQGPLVKAGDPFRRFASGGGWARLA